MIDLFRDKAYEELDDISQIVEPYQYGVNNDLALFPEEIILDSNFIKNELEKEGSNRSYLNFSLASIVISLISDLNLNNLRNEIRYSYRVVDMFFDLQVSDGATFNASTNELIGEIKIVKKKLAYEDKEIQALMMTYLKNKFSDMSYKPSRISKSRLNEICDLFNSTEALQDRSASGKLSYLFDKYKELISNRSLNIRDVDLFKRFVDWNYMYIVNGSLPAMSNITKIKIMMRSGLPIYSLKEEVI